MNALDQKKSEHPTPTDTSSWEGHSPRAGAFGRLAVSGMVDFYVCITLIKQGEAYDYLENTRDCDSVRCGSHDLGTGVAFAQDTEQCAGLPSQGALKNA